MKTIKPTYQELQRRLAIAEPVVEALKNHEVDAVVGEGKIAFLLLRGVEEALLASEAGFNAMFDLPGIGLIQADTSTFHFTRVNQKFCAMMGYSPEELLTKTYIGLTHPDDRQQGLQQLTQGLRGKKNTWSVEKRCLRKDGSVIRVQVHGTVLRDQTGRAVRIMAMIGELGGVGVPTHRSPAKGKGGRVRPPDKAGKSGKVVAPSVRQRYTGERGRSE